MTPVQRAGAAGGLAAVLALAAPVVMSWEGLRQDPYVDLVGVRTVCYGETRNVQNRRYSKAECDALLTKSLTDHAKPILGCIPVTAPLEVKAAFVSFGYNVGVSAVCKSTAVKLMWRGDYRGACDQLLRWDRAGGKVVKGLTRRRQDERTLCLSGL